MKNRPFLERLGFALFGVSMAWRRERSFRTQVMIGVAATVFTAVMAPSLIWAAAVALSIALVLALELFNSALECLVDHLHPEMAPEIKLAKDIAAGAVLVASFSAIMVGALMIVAILLR